MSARKSLTGGGAPLDPGRTVAPAVEVEWTMRTRTRLGAVAGLALCVGLALSLAAPDVQAAGGTPVTVVQSNWFWYHQADAASGTGLEVLPEPSGVPKDDLSVAYTGGTTTDTTQPSKETYLAFDLSGLDPASTITSFTFTLTLDGAAQVKTTTPVLIACAPVRNWNNGSGTPWSEKPIDDCSTAIAATGKADTKAGTYTFAIPSLAQSWLSDVNTGVAIRHDPVKQKAPFQLNFTGAAKVTATIAYQAPISAPPAPSDAFTPPVSDPGTSTGSLGGTGIAPGLGAPTGAVPTVDLPSSPPVQLAPQQPVAASLRVGNASSMPSPGFWLVGLAILGFLVLVSLVIGDTNTAPAAGQSRRPGRVSRLDQLLRSRRTSFTLEPR
jgi:hypothetical protein